MKKVRLGEVCDIYAGTGFPIEYQGNRVGIYPFYKVGDISRTVSSENKYLGVCDNYINDDIVKILKGTVIPKETIVFAKIGEAIKLNRRAITSCNCLIDNNVMGIRPNFKYLNLDYLYYYMCGLKLEVLAESTTVPSVKKSVIEKLEIPYLTINEQQKIASVLDKINDLITLRKQQLAKLDELVKSRFVEMFGNNAFTEKELREVCRFIDYRGKTPQKSSSGIPLITAKNVRKDGFSKDPVEYIPEMIFDKWMTRGYPRVGDVLFTTEAPMGNVCRIPNLYHKFAVGQRIVTLQPQPSVLSSIYLEKALLSSSFQDKLVHKSSGSTVTGIRSKLLERLTIPLPPLSLQNEFAAFIEQLDKTKSAIQKSLEETQLLFDSLMQTYFG